MLSFIHTRADLASVHVVATHPCGRLWSLQVVESSDLVVVHDAAALDTDELLADGILLGDTLQSIRDLARLRKIWVCLMNRIDHSRIGIHVSVGGEVDLNGV